MATRVNLTFIDIEGETRKTGFWTTTAFTSANFAATFLPLVTAFEATTSGAVIKMSVQLNAAYPNLAGAGAYQTVEDKMYLQVVDADGFYTTFSVPSPEGTVFDTTTEKVDPLDAAVIALITQLIALAASKAGTVLVGLYKGWRKRSKGY